MEISCGINDFGLGPILGDWGKPIHEAWRGLGLGAYHTKNFSSRTIASPQEILVEIKNPNFEGLPRCTLNFCGEVLLRESHVWAPSTKSLVDDQAWHPQSPLRLS